MGSTLERTLCAYHPDRVAVVRCPRCGDTYCDECVTEHEGRMVCRKCLEQHVTPEMVRSKRSWSVGSLIQRGVGLVWGVLALYALWMTLYILGSALIEMPSDFHEGTLWLDGME